MSYALLLTIKSFALRVIRKVTNKKWNHSQILSNNITIT